MPSRQKNEIKVSNSLLAFLDLHHRDLFNIHTRAAKKVSFHHASGILHFYNYGESQFWHEIPPYIRAGLLSEQSYSWITQGRIHTKGRVLSLAHSHQWLQSDHRQVFQHLLTETPLKAELQALPREGHLDVSEYLEKLSSLWTVARPHVSKGHRAWIRQAPHGQLELHQTPEANLSLQTRHPPSLKLIITEEHLKIHPEWNILRDEDQRQHEVSHILIHPKKES